MNALPAAAVPPPPTTLHDLLAALRRATAAAEALACGCRAADGRPVVPAEAAGARLAAALAEVDRCRRPVGN